MTQPTQIDGHILTPGGFVRGHLQLRGGRIAAVQGTAVSEAQARADATCPLILPGFVDLHLHGGGARLAWRAAAARRRRDGTVGRAGIGGGHGAQRKDRWGVTVNVRPAMSTS